MRKDLLSDFIFDLIDQLEDKEKTIIYEFSCSHEDSIEKLKVRTERLRKQANVLLNLK